MSDGAMLIEAAQRLFADRIDDAAMRRARGGEWIGEAWDAIAEMGLPLALVSEEAGGFGVETVDALALVRLAGAHALPLPLAETMLANGALGAAGLPLAEGPAALIDGAGLTIAGEGAGWRITGTAARVPWARDLSTLVVADGAHTFRIGAGCTVAERSTNLAAMPRDDLAIDAYCEASGPATGVSPLLAGAALRSLQIAGALETVLALTIEHVSDRVQFGRSLSKFQAVQHELAKLGGDVAVAGAAADMAAEALAGDPAEATLAIAAATIRAREAAGSAVAIAQQLHGAIGFTVEHRLHWYTTALWSWRDEEGGTRYWSDLLGRAALAAGGAGFWQFVTEAA
ncbi:acyl-CoA dehydrogenase family protein [Sphingomonas immobilis]|uniref:Acyl-CoA dehydrogenase family protein n=1 Tax=Sphingomonas immobilis TaxID=3063997 RepID=A0ABT8ZX22_9SPHN|nr:acyl-CoA dehydrogenase family protein [Sphingomonas sp. CA1-15]MDO7842098.1 acyl-CoA dehydrogenase family protein [Sphingomonas sp. CA1-15]